MAVSTTFGYNVSEDRIWISCAAWPQRVWITRRLARAMVQAVVGVLESAAATSPAAAARPATERAAAAHDASLNQPQPGEQGRALQMGREAANAPALQHAVLCAQFALEAPGAQHDLVFHTPPVSAACAFPAPACTAGCTRCTWCCAAPTGPTGPPRPTG
ncbi:hypothetical protein H0I39_03740 [Ottowia beijingensis]|uniref:Uncharacterized protein n=1 Tax=Ottowia beijingensis TaxID=1207057 RepID=A0A853ITQ4_9BURK|nr:hypothetical protein [Ottowia beijingensis]NZA01101.1 hypothetical protein [Ottowia beijingensis]